MIGTRACKCTVLAACALLAACGQSDGEPGPGGVTVGEARALDQAAEMLDQQRLPEEALAEPDAPVDAPAEAQDEVPLSPAAPEATPAAR